MTYGEIIKMIDEYTELPSCIDNKWVKALMIIRKLLVKEIDKMEESKQITQEQRNDTYDIIINMLQLMKE